jgi:hypothetical protein
MRSALGIIAIAFAGLVGVVEFRAITDPTIAQSIASGFAAHDPFPRHPAVAYLSSLDLGRHP